MSQKWTQGKNNENATWPRGLTLVGTFGQNGVTWTCMSQIHSRLFCMSQKSGELDNPDDASNGMSRFLRVSTNPKDSFMVFEGCATFLARDTERKNSCCLERMQCRSIDCSARFCIFAQKAAKWGTILLHQTACRIRFRARCVHWAPRDSVTVSGAWPSDLACPGTICACATHEAESFCPDARRTAHSPRAFLLFDPKVPCAAFLPREEFHRRMWKRFGR